MSISETPACAVAVAVTLALKFVERMSPLIRPATSNILAMPRSPVLAWVRAVRSRCLIS